MTTEPASPMLVSPLCGGPYSFQAKPCYLEHYPPPPPSPEVLVPASPHFHQRHRGGGDRRKKSEKKEHNSKWVLAFEVEKSGGWWRRVGGSIKMATLTAKRPWFFLSTRYPHKKERILEELYLNPVFGFHVYVAQLFETFPYSWSWTTSLYTTSYIC